MYESERERKGENFRISESKEPRGLALALTRN